MNKRTAPNGGKSQGFPAGEAGERSETEEVIGCTTKTENLPNIEFQEAYLIRHLRAAPSPAGQCRQPNVDT